MASADQTCWCGGCKQEEQRAEAARVVAREEAIRTGLERKRREDELFREQVRLLPTIGPDKNCGFTAACHFASMLLLTCCFLLGWTKKI